MYPAYLPSLGSRFSHTPLLLFFDTFPCTPSHFSVRALLSCPLSPDDPAPVFAPFTPRNDHRILFLRVPRRSSRESEDRREIAPKTASIDEKAGLDHALFPLARFFSFLALPSTPAATPAGADEPFSFLTFLTGGGRVSGLGLRLPSESDPSSLKRGTACFPCPRGMPVPTRSSSSPSAPTSDSDSASESELSSRARFLPLSSVRRDWIRLLEAESGVTRVDWSEAMAAGEKGSARREPVQDRSELDVVRLRALGDSGQCSSRSHSDERKSGSPDER